MERLGVDHRIRRLRVGLDQVFSLGVVTARLPPSRFLPQVEHAQLRGLLALVRQHDQPLEHLRSPHDRNVRRLAQPKNFFLYFSQAFVTQLDRERAMNADCESRWSVQSVPAPHLNTPL